MLIQRIHAIGLKAVAEDAGVRLRMARNWLERFRLGGPDAILPPDSEVTSY